MRRTWLKLSAVLRSFGRLLKRSVLARYPDDTTMIARRIAHYLEPGETVLAAVFVQSPGTISAQIQGGTSAAGSAALGHYGGDSPGDDKRHALWKQQFEQLGIDPELAQRTTKVVVAVTTSRLLLVRRGGATGRMRELLVAWPAGEVDRVTVPRRGNSLRIFRDGNELRCELPNEHRFIADVYRELPGIFAEVQAASRTESDT